MTLQSNVSPYTVVERATRIYNGVLDIFDYNSSSDVTTPFQLALKQVKELPTRSGKILVPGAGIGTYILALLQEGITPDQITAVELHPAYSRLGYGIFNRLGVNYVSADFLKWQPNMKFDVIIGNPPYQNPNKGKKAANGRSSNGSPLWVKFIKKSSELLKDGGTLSLLVPSAVTTPKSRGMNAAKGLTLSSVKFNMDAYFRVGTDISHVTWVKGEEDVPLMVNGLTYPRSLPIANVADPSEFNRLVSIWSGEANWEYMDNRGHHRRSNKEGTLVIRRMYSGDTFKYNVGLDMNKFDKESLVGIECSSDAEMEQWVNFLDSDASKFIRRVTNYAGNISAAFLRPVNPNVLN